MDPELSPILYSRNSLQQLRFAWLLKAIATLLCHSRRTHLQVVGFQPIDTTVELAYYHDTRNTHTHRFPGNDSRKGTRPSIVPYTHIISFTWASVVTTELNFNTEPRAPRQLGAFASTSVEASSAPRRRRVFACSGVGGWGWAFFQIVCSSPRERDARNCPVLCCSWSITQ